jgi:hypothetical protein
MRHLYLGLAALLAMFLSSCASCWVGGIPMRDSELHAQWGAEYDILHSAKDVKIYKGLAHPKGDKVRYAEQVRAGGWVEFEGFKFFAKPVDFPTGTAEKVLKLYCKSDSHQALALKTTCPGFHPDYALVWSADGQRRVLQICYGCHEWKYFGPGGTVHTDINEPAYFQGLLPLLPKGPRHIFKPERL